MKQHTKVWISPQVSERIKESGKVVVVLYYSSIGVERRVLRDKSYRYVNEVFTTHEGGGDLREEREEDYVGNTQEEKESEQIPNYLLQSIEIDELSFNSIPERCALKINSDLVFCFLCNFRCCLCVVHKSYPPFLVSLLVEYERAENTGYCRDEEDYYEEVHP